MNKDKKVDETKTAAELSREEKKALRRDSLKEKTTISIDESLKKPGMVYRLCNVTPGNIDFHRSRGYEVCQNQIPTGDGSLSNAVTAKGCTEVEVGKVESLKAVWMETSEENYEILRELDAEKAKAQDDMLNESEIPEENRIGSVTKNRIQN